MIYVFLAEGFEEIEAITVIDVLLRGEVDVKTVSITDSLQVTGSHGISVIADTVIDKTDIKNADAVIFPGGMPGTKNLDESKEVDRIIFEANNSGKWIAAICAAPMILGKRGLLKGKEAVCFPGFEKYLEGAVVKADKAIVSANIITSRGAGTAFDFAWTILSVIGKKNIGDKLRQSMLYS